MPKDEYGGFTAMLQLLNLIAIPAIGLQAVFAVKAAQRKTEADDFRMHASNGRSLSWCWR